MENDIKQKVKEIERLNKQRLKLLRGEARKEYKKTEHKLFDEIYQMYGEKEYTEYVPKKYRKRDIRQLLKEQRFSELYNKHGEKTFKKYSPLIVNADVVYETNNKILGKLYEMLYRARHLLKHQVAPIALSTLMVPSAVGLLSDSYQETQIAGKQAEITEYLNDIDVYGSKIAKYNLTDIQNIMLVMDDMWSNIQGYGDNNDIMGCEGLSLKEKINEKTGEKELGYGVCRNMADYYAAVFNSIDKAYNARVVVVKMNHGRGYVPADVDIREVENTDENTNEGSNNHKESVSDKIIFNAFGNHAITVIYSREDPNVQLVVDPTNGGVGVLNNGKIEMFNSEEIDPLVHTQTFLGEAFLEGTKIKFENDIGNIRSTFSLNHKEMEDLKKKYGVEAQNKALKEIKKYQENSFVESLRVHEEEQHNNNVDKENEFTKKNKDDIER